MADGRSRSSPRSPTGLQAARLAAALLAQRLRPAEVIAGCPAANAGDAAAVRDALGALARHGIRVVVTETGPAEREVDGADRARPLARLARAAWLAPWTADGGQTERLPARPGLRAGMRAGRRRRLASGRHSGAGEYEFTRWLDEPALVRAELLGHRGPAAGDWGSHGLRLFTIAPAGAGR